jgi:hypothetical protein
MKHLRILLVPAAVLLLVGCQVERKQTTALIGFGPEIPHAVTTVEVEGDYLLFRGDSKYPMARHHLKVGEAIGFKPNAIDLDRKPVGEKGTLSAVAGQFAVPVVAGESYEWRMIPATATKTKQQNPYWPRP